MTESREARFNDLIELAAFTAHTPMASMTIIDSESAWFKATLGFESDGISRAESICGHTVAAGAPLFVPDLTTDERFADNPLVVGPLGIRSYAGFPLLLDDGLAVGTMCVMDTRPRTLLSDELHALRVIADQVTTQLRLDQLAALTDTD